jgi:predicted Zn-dependent protease
VSDAPPGTPPRDDRAALEERIAAFREVVRAEPDDPVANFGLAQTLLSAGRFAEAADVFATVTRLSPRYTAAYRGLGRALEGAGRVDDAIRAYRDGIVVSRETGDLQTGKEMRVFLQRLGAEPTEECD